MDFVLIMSQNSAGDKLSSRYIFLHSSVTSMNRLRSWMRVRAAGRSRILKRSNFRFGCSSWSFSRVAPRVVSCSMIVAATTASSAGALLGLLFLAHFGHLQAGPHTWPRGAGDVSRVPESGPSSGRAILRVPASG